MKHTVLRKHGSLAIALVVALVFALALTFVAMNGKVEKAYADQPTTGIDNIEFTVSVTGDTTRYIDDTNIGDTVVVTYKITNNDGINSILLVPEYDSSVFAISNISVNEETSLGGATQGVGTGKVLLENTGAAYTDTFDDDETVFMTVTYSIIAATNGEYEFGLVLTSAQANGASVAYFIEDGESKGEQTEVQITVVKANDLTLVVKEQPTITIGYDFRNTIENETRYDYTFEYFKGVILAERVSAFGIDSIEDAILAPNDYEYTKVYYTFTDEAGDSIAALNTPTITYAWYYEAINNEWIEMKDELDAPVNPGMPGNYKVVISSEASDLYYSATATRYFDIHARRVYIDMSDKESAYGDSILPLTDSGFSSDAICQGDNIVYNVTTTATSSSNVGTYPITGSVDIQNSTGYIMHDDFRDMDVAVYDVVFRGESNTQSIEPSNAVYTITVKQISATIDDKTSAYGEDLVALTYTLSPAIDGLTITLYTDADNTEPGTYDITIVDTFGFGTNYELVVTNTDQKATYTITSAPKLVAYFEPFFSGDTVTYDGDAHDLLIVENGAPEAWWEYTVSNNNQTNANTYVITVTVNVKEGYTELYSLEKDNEAVSQVTLTVNGTINRKDVILSVVSISRYYGQEPVIVPSFNVDGTTEELDYTYAFKDNGVAFTPAANTAVGVYDIDLTEGTNPNFNVTYVDGTYTVNKATATVSAAANDVYYNRDLDVSATASVNTLALTPTITYYSDNACTQEVTPENVGIYYAKAVVAETSNYYGAEDVADFSICQVAIDTIDASYDYNYGTIYWVDVTQDAGAEKALKEGVTVTYEIYNGNDVLISSDLIDTTSEEGKYIFQAQEATDYYVVAIPSDTTNYSQSVYNMRRSYSVTFTEGTHPADSVSPENMPATQYIFTLQQIDTDLVTDPTLPHSNFQGWVNPGTTTAFNFSSTINDANVVIEAYWSTKQYTVTFKYLETSETEDTDLFEVELAYGAQITLPEMSPVKPAEAGMSFTYNETWIYGENTYGVEEGKLTINEGFATVIGDMVFVAQYDVTYGVYTVTFYWNYDGGDYAEYSSAEVAFGSAITYPVLSNVTLFRKTGWFTNEARTAAAPATMPADDLDVYMGYEFDLGKGDVNGDGNVTANDITLYRKWIVGGYEMTVIESGAEWDLVHDDYDAEGTYFFARVADNNADNYSDIRDVSVTRMAIVGGYAWDIVTGDRVTGAEIIRNTVVTTLAQLEYALGNGTRVTLVSLINESEEDVSVSRNGDIYLDLNGNTISLDSLTLYTAAQGATITVKNGTIVTVNGVDISAPNGNVVIEDITAYDQNGEIALQAASSSLHFFGDVEFIEAPTATVNVDGDVEIETLSYSAPAVLKIAEDTHVVVEEEADLKVEKVVVYTTQIVEQQEVKVVKQAAEATLAIDVKSEVTTVIEVIADQIIQAEESIAAKLATSVSDVTEFNNAIAAGKSIKLTADITLTDEVVINSEVEINVNNHTITAASGKAAFKVQGGKLTLSGEGKVMATGSPYKTIYFMGSTDQTATNYSVLNVGKDVTVESVGGYAVMASANDNKAYGVVANIAGTLVGKYGGLYINGSVRQNNGDVANNAPIQSIATFNVESTATVYTTDSENAAIYAAGFAKWNIKAGAEIEGGSAIYIKTGFINIEDGAVLTANMENALPYYYNGNGADATGDALIIDNCYYPGENAVVTLGANLEESITVAAEGAKKIGNYWYVSTKDQVKEAFAASGEKCVVLGANITSNEYLIVASGNTTLDLNGKSVTFTNGAGFRAYYSGIFTITGNGNVTTSEVCLYAVCGGTIIVNGGNYTSIDNFVIGTNGSEGVGENTIIVNAGTFNGQITTAGYVACGIYVANDDNVTVNGGTFNITNGVGILARSGNTVVNADVIFNVTGTGLTGKVGDSKVNVPSGAVLVIDYAANYPGGDPALVNNTVNNVYTVVGSVAELNAASGNVVLGNNISTDNTERIIIRNDMTLNLNGYTIASSNDVAIRVSGTGVDLTIVGNGNVNAREGCVMPFAGASITINGGTYTCTDNFVFGTNGSSDQGGNTITVNAGTFNGGIISAGYVACGIYVANNDTVVVNGGTFNITDGCGILARSGNTTIGENVVINVTGNTTGKVGDSRVVVPAGAEIVLDNAANYPGGAPTVSNNSSYQVTEIIGD